MSTTVINVKQAVDARDVVHRAVAALSAGQIVALPTETVYGLAASALSESAVKRLLALKGRPEGKPLALAVKSADDALDYAPDMSTVARRLTRRLWPGPLTLVTDGGHQDSVLRRLPLSVQQAIQPEATVGFRVTSHELSSQILRLLAGPLVLTSANRSGDRELAEAAAIPHEFDHQVDVVIDDGRCLYGKPSTVVRVDGSEVTILREGALDEKSIKTETGFVALLVCTGNTCRSPMAERLMKKHFASQLGCQIDELESRGVRVSSCGIAAMNGGRPSVEAEMAMEGFGIDLTSHASRAITNEMVLHADLILSMTETQRAAVVANWPEVTARTHLLSKDGQNITDPIGQSESVYQQCASQIDEHVGHWVRATIQSGAIVGHPK